MGNRFELWNAQEWDEQTNVALDLSQAEAIMDLIHARSERALAAANQQLRGSLGRRMDWIITILVNILANIEAYIDFPDEDLPFSQFTMHFFVMYEDDWREVNIRTFNQLLALGCLPRNL